MAYNINRDDEQISITDGPVTEKEVRKIIKQKKPPEFYELEAAEVLQCYLDDEDLPMNSETGGRDYSQYGWIEARMLISNKGPQDTIVAQPMNSDIKRYPYPNEYVIIAEYFGQFFYTQKINLRNRTDTNMAPGLSKTGVFSVDITKENLPIIENSDIRTLNAEEGDVTFEGRFGNTIRMGSNVKEVKTDDGVEENTGKENSPNIIIRTGQGIVESLPNKPVKEDINKDSSSVWMTTDQVVPFQKSSNMAHGKTVPKEYDGKQILINSDRIVFNTKLNSIHAFSKKEISLAGDRRISFESPIVNLADRMATEPALAGDITMDLIDKLLDALVDFASSISRSMGTCISFKIPIDSIMGPSMQLAYSLQSLKTRMDEPKSKTVFVGNPKGPTVT